MASFIIEGGHPLSGEITPQGAKNEALQILCAVLLTDEPVIVHNVPDIVDIRRLIKILSSIGVEVTPLGGSSIQFQASQIDLEFMKTKDYVKLSGKIRASIMTIGPLLGRFGVAYASAPGGDKIGRRPLTTHFEGFEKLGATMSHHKGMIYKLKAAPLKGCYILLNEASVTGTANLVMAAVLAKGTTTIFNAACEPYLLQLCRMLNRMGAKISGLGSNLLTIEGVEKLHGCEHTVLPDMIEIGSFIGMAALNRSEITIKDCSWENLGIIPYTFSKLGIKLEQRGDDIFVPKQKEYVIERQMDGSILTIADAPWPGFTPDLISIALVTAVQGKGSVLIHQKMFESRLFFVDSLQSMGAQIILCDPHRATVIGMNHQIPLRATKMASPDIRAGVALLIAALSAEGTSEIQNVEQIDRGYQDIVNRLNSLGANIIRED